MIDIIKRHPEHEVIIGMDTLGKEGLLIRIAQELGIKVGYRTVANRVLPPIVTTPACRTLIVSLPAPPFPSPPPDVQFTRLWTALFLAQPLLRQWHSCSLLRLGFLCTMHLLSLLSTMSQPSA